MKEFIEWVKCTIIATLIISVCIGAGIGIAYLFPRAAPVLGAVILMFMVTTIVRVARLE